MQANVQVLKHENISGEGKNGPYNLDFIHFLDVSNFDKFKLLVRGDDLDKLKASTGKRGVLEVCVNPKTDKLDFSDFKAAA